MPDADDFDVEYFRSLLKGPGPKEHLAPPAETPAPAPKKKARPTTKPAAPKATSRPSAGRKKSRI